MRYLTTRRVLIWTAVPLLVAQVGCAARVARVAPAPPPAAVSQVDRTACETFAQRAKATRAKTDQEKSVLGPAVLGVVLVPLAAVGIAILDPHGLMAVGDAFTWATKNAQHNTAVREARQATYEQAMTDCLQPAILERALGPDHPNVATSLTRLADGYASQGREAEAEPLYQRALAIQEKGLGPDHPEVAVTLDGYTALLRRAHRDREPVELEARAKAIRAKAESDHPKGVITGDGPPPETAEPAAPHALMPPSPEPVE